MQEITKFQRTASLASTLLSLLEIVIGLYHLWKHRILANADYDDAVSRSLGCSTLTDSDRFPGSIFWWKARWSWLDVL